VPQAPEPPERTVPLEELLSERKRRQELARELAAAKAAQKIGDDQKELLI